MAKDQLNKGYGFEHDFSHNIEYKRQIFRPRHRWDPNIKNNVAEVWMRVYIG
jgi:hypothetical protein